MFWGEYTHHLDSKGRLIIPSRFRAYLTEQAVLTRGLDHNLVVYPQATWHTVSQQINQIPFTHPASRALRRLLFSGALELVTDKQGRVNIPPYLREYAALDDEVLIVGMETFIEIWQPKRWYDALKDVSDTLKDDDSLLKLGL